MQEDARYGILLSSLFQEFGLTARQLIEQSTYETWVAIFLEDRKAREEIKACQQEITALDKAPVDKDEFKKQFLAMLQGLRRQALAGLSGEIALIQQKKSFFKPVSLTNVPMILAGFLEMKFSQEEQEIMFANLVDNGITTKEKEARQAKLARRIQELEAHIAEKLSPPERWLYNPLGRPVPYPQGCRWTRFVETWQQVAVTYSEPVTIKGHAIDNDLLSETYHKLGLDKLPKVSALNIKKPLKRR